MGLKHGESTLAGLQPGAALTLGEAMYWSSSSAPLCKIVSSIVSPEITIKSK